MSVKKSNTVVVADRFCPVSGLPIIQKPEWKIISYGKSYSTSLSVIGGRIVLDQPSGYSNLEDIIKAFELMDQAIHEAVGENESYIFIHDLTSYQGLSLEARRYYISRLKKDSRVLAVIFFGASPMMKLSIRIGRRLTITKFNVEIFDEYHEAIEFAVKKLFTEKKLSFDLIKDTFRSSSILLKKDRSKEISTTLDWVLRLKGFSARFEIIEKDIFHVHGTGYFEEDHVAPVFKMHDKIFHSTDAPKGPYYFVLGATGIDRSSMKARKRYIEYIKEWYKRHPFEMYIFYGADRILSAAVNLARPFSPFKAKVVKDLDSALALIHQEKIKGIKYKPQTIGKTPFVKGWIQQYVDELIRYLGSIDWEGDGSDSPREADASHPFSPVFDAIDLIKSEIDELFQERKLAEDALKKAHDDLEVRIKERTRELERANTDLHNEIEVRQWAAEELRESEERFRRLFDQSNDAIIIHQRGKIIDVNQKACEMLGYEKQQLFAMSITDIEHKDNRKEHQVSANISEGDKSIVYETRWKKACGTLIDVELSSGVIDTENGIIEEIGRDISDRKRLQAQLHHVQKMQAIGTLASGIAHNFNNLLLGIIGNTSIMLLDMDPDHPYYQNLKSIEKQVESGSKLTGQLLGYARGGRYQIRPLNLNQLVKEFSDTYGTTRKDIRIYQDLDETLYGIIADQGQIEQILLNLYLNAADAMPRGGDLHIKTMNAVYKDIKNKLYKIKPGNYVLLMFSDKGVGMDKDTTRRIFEPFFTTKGFSKGTGLGLASVYGIVKGYGGYIDVDSEIGQGTTFTIYLPATRTKAVLEEKKAHGEFSKGDGTILLVDDEDIVIDVGSRMLKRIGYDTLLASSGKEALKIYRENQDKIDIVILDMIMPDICGGEIYDLLKKINPDIKVLLASGYSIDGQAMEILSKGCDGFIQKPFNIMDLSKTLKEVLNKGVKQKIK